MDLYFVETSAFTRQLERLGLEADLVELQARLRNHPTAGALDPGTGGLRKVRMGAPSRGRGQRGVARVHYLWLPGPRVIYLIWVYAKGRVATLSQGQKLQLRQIAEGIKAEWRPG